MFNLNNGTSEKETIQVYFNLVVNCVREGGVKKIQKLDTHTVSILKYFYNVLDTECCIVSL